MDKFLHLYVINTTTVSSAKLFRTLDAVIGRFVRCGPSSCSLLFGPSLPWRSIPVAAIAKKKLHFELVRQTFPVVALPNVVVPSPNVSVSAVVIAKKPCMVQWLRGSVRQASPAVVAHHSVFFCHLLQVFPFLA